MFSSSSLERQKWLRYILLGTDLGEATTAAHIGQNRRTFRVHVHVCKMIDLVKKIDTQCTGICFHSSVEINCQHKILPSHHPIAQNITIQFLQRNVVKLEKLKFKRMKKKVGKSNP